MYPITVLMLNYRGYFATPEYSAEDGVLYGKILGISDLVDFQAESAEDVEPEFCRTVNDYMVFCAGIGKEPLTTQQKIPNATTLKAMEDAETDEHMYGPFDSVAEMMEALNA